MSLRGFQGFTVDDSDWRSVDFEDHVTGFGEQTIAACQTGLDMALLFFAGHALGARVFFNEGCAPAGRR